MPSEVLMYIRLVLDAAGLAFGRDCDFLDVGAAPHWRYGWQW